MSTIIGMNVLVWASSGQLFGRGGGVGAQMSKIMQCNGSIRRIKTLREKQLHNDL